MSFKTAAPQNVILQPGHPNHLLLEGANNRNVNISHRFLAAPVQANRLANQLFISIVSTRLNIHASYQSAYSGLRFLGEIPAGVMILSMYEFQPQTSIRSDWGSRPPGPSPWDVGNNLREFGIQDWWRDRRTKKSKTSFEIAPEANRLVITSPTTQI